MTDDKSKSKALVKYTLMDDDVLDQQERAIGFGGGGGQYFKWQDGKNIVRFMPGMNGSAPFVPLWKHSVKGAGDGKFYNGPCPLKMAKLPCLTCMVAAKLSRGTDADRDMTQDVMPRSKVLGNLIDRSAPDAGPQIAEFGKSIYDPIRDIKRTMGEDPTHPDDGFDLVIEKEGSGLNTKYKVIPKRQNSPLHIDPAQAAAWLEEAADLSRFLVLPSEAEQAQRLAGTILGPYLGKGKAAPAQPRSQHARAREAIDVDVQAEDDDDSAY